LRRLLLAGVALLAGGEARSQQEPPVFAAAVEMVRLDVAVTRDGGPVRDLEARHFEVRDNGVLQRVEIVGREHKRMHAVLTLDNSASLAGARLGRLKAAAHALLDALGPDDAVSLLTFSDRLELRAGPGAPRDRVHAAIEETEARLTTALNDAAFAALTLADPAFGRPIVLLFTDGQDVGSWLRPDPVLRAARSADLVSHVVFDGPPGSGTSFIEELAAATGGEVWKGEQLELEDAFVTALEEFRSRYTLQYAATRDPSADARDEWHEIDVRVRVPGAEVRAREGYLRPRWLPQ
jgi:VWFA-related protein